MTRICSRKKEEKLERKKRSNKMPWMDVNWSIRKSGLNPTLCDYENSAKTNRVEGTTKAKKQKKIRQKTPLKRILA